MKATFETTEFGRIEVRRCNSTGSWAGIAYFYKQDWEVTVEESGQFRDLDGRIFQVFWGMHANTSVVLEVLAPRHIGTVKPEKIEINKVA